jgi:uncharacterized protein (DUF1778 family)
MGNINRVTNTKSPVKKSIKKTGERVRISSSGSEKTKTSRLGFRASEPQAKIIRMASDISHKSLTDFIMDSAYQAAEKVILDQRLFIVSEEVFQKFSDMLERPIQENKGLDNLFSSSSPWDINDNKKA